jgi:hypothetical protein
MRIELPTAAALALVALCAFAPAARGLPQDQPETVPLGPNKVECRPFTTGAERTSSTCGARVAANGRAVPPPGAPAAVRETIEAANRIAHKPYVWGGGHQSWVDRGYDCSGAVGYALHGAGMLGWTMVSGEMESWGVGGAGRWITVYANREHVYMVVAGLRFDTRDAPRGTGPRWHTDMPREPHRFFTSRHPAGL